MATAVTYAASGRSGYLWLWLLLACLLVASVIPTVTKRPPTPLASGGSLDLRSWDATGDGPVPLAGEWEFYWQQLLVPGEFGGREPQLERVPSLWTKYPGELPVVGYATFRLRVELPENPPSLAIYSAGEGSAYALWVNGRHVGGVGVVGPDRASSEPGRQRRTYFLPGDARTMEVVVQIANFDHRKAGFRNALVLGGAEQLHNYQRIQWALDAFIVGVILVFGVQYLVMYLFRRDDSSALYFGLLTLAVGLRASLTNQGLLSWLTPEILWGSLLKVEYLVFFLTPALYTGFMRALYPQEFSLRMLQVFWVVGLAFSAGAVFSSTLVASYLVPPFQVLYALAIAVVFFCLYRVFQRRREYWQYIIAASVLCASLNLLELLHAAGFTPRSNLSHVGFLAFLIVQSIMLSARSGDTHRRAAQLSGDLEERNLSLQRSERKYRALFEDSQDVIFIASLEGKIVDVNPACEHLLGYRPEEIIGMVDMERLASAQERKRFYRLIRDSGAAVDFETTVIHRDGSSVPIAVTATPRVDEQGRLTGFQGYVRNLSDRLEAEEQRRRAERLEQIVAIDPLTRTFNRRYFQEAAGREIARARRQGTPLSLVLFDIDLFKSINDRYGHISGDKVLVSISRLVNSKIRSTDVLARYGGEEFVVMLPDTQLQWALLRAEDLRHQVERQATRAQSGELIHATISLGVAQWRDDEDLTSLLERADKALYAAKSAGRNRASSEAACIDAGKIQSNL